MSAQHAEGWTRRRFLGGLTLAGTAGLLSVSSRPVMAAPPPETTRIRLVHDPSICVTPQYLAEELLRADGFSEVQYVEATDGLGTRLVAAGGADMMMEFAGVYLTRIDAGDPIVLLGGVHIGCFEVFGGSHVRAVRDLKDKRVAVLGMDPPSTCFCPVWWPTWGSIRAGTSAGSRILLRSRCACSRQARSTPSRGSRRSRRSYAPGGSATWCSTRPRIARGPNTSAAWSAPTVTLYRSTPSRLNGRCAPS